jgi:hypothetical protein
MNECPFLIDDKAVQESQGKAVKEQFTIQIDSVRKSLGIDNMDDVELLVLTFYETSDRNVRAQNAGGLLGGPNDNNINNQDFNDPDHMSQQDGTRKNRRKQSGIDIPDDE